MMAILKTGRIGKAGNGNKTTKIGTTKAGGTTSIRTRIPGVKNVLS